MLFFLRNKMENISGSDINLSIKLLGININSLSIIVVKYFIKLKDIAYENNYYELSMGMSNDYIPAVQNGSSFIRIGSKIFGARLS